MPTTNIVQRYSSDRVIYNGQFFPTVLKTKKSGYAIVRKSDDVIREIKKILR